MTPDERQALREKHVREDWNGGQCSYCEHFHVDNPEAKWSSGAYENEPWPCDVIKVLDAWEATL